MKIIEKEVNQFVDSEYTEETLRVVEYLKEKYIPYKELKRNRVFRSALVWILKYKGYTYLSNKLYYLLNKKEVDYKEIYESLINANIINREKIEYKTDLEKEIEFRSSEGISKSFYIKLIKNKYPFKVKYISNEYKGLVNLTFENNEFYDYININILAQENIKYPINIRETIIIYTDYKTLFFELDIKKRDIIEGNFYDIKIFNSLHLMKERTRRIFAVSKGMERLLEEKDKDFALNYIKKIKNVSIGLEVYKKYKDYIKYNGENLSVKFSLEILEKYMDFDEVNIKLGLLIEEFILENYLITEKIKLYLEKLYSEGFFTDNTEEVIQVLKFTDLNLQLKKKFKIIDNDTLEDFKKGNVSLEMANKILCSKGIRYDNRLIKIMYDFYKETDDVRALEIVIKKKDKFKFKIKDEDIIFLIQKKKEGINIKSESILLGGRDFELKNIYIQNEMKKIKKEISNE